MKAYFELFAAYNTWANQRLYKAAALLCDKDYYRDEKVFFGSIHNTLNHILVGDRIWMQRFTGEGMALRDLNAILCDTLFDLQEQRQLEDARISNWISSLSDHDLMGDLTYLPITEPDEVTTPLAPLIGHFFNHQTHHRGQVHALLTRFTCKAPSLDLVYYQFQMKNGEI